MGSREEESLKLDSKMKEPQRYALLRKWDSFKNYYYRNNPADLIKPFNLGRNTAIQIAARTGNTDLIIRELLDMLPDDSHRQQALRMGNAHKNTLLHQIVSCEQVKIVDTVLNYEMEKNLKQPGDQNLLELRNDLGETPVYRAAKHGGLRMLKCMARYVENNGPHFYRTKDYASILHIAITGQHFDVSVWLSKKEGIEKVAFAYEEVSEGENYRLSCLQLLSRMPSVFSSHNSQAGFAHNLIYLCLPNKGYDDDDVDKDDDNEDEDKDGDDGLESGKKKVKKSISPSPVAVSSRIYYAFWKLVAKGDDLGSLLKRVKKIVPCHYQLFCNDNKLTARELFDLEHSEMLKEAQEWIKSTAQSCSAVSVLVATVVFAAAYTVPGGTDDHGVPNLINSPLFLFFTVMDVVGLASSLVSVMLFLSILTSPFQMREFHKSLPRKLTMGFAFLFISLTTTLLAFGSTILLTIRMENKKWSSSLIYSVTFFAVTLFGLTQFPIVMAVKYRTKRLWKNLKKIIPNDVITMSTKTTCKRDYSKYL